MGEQQGQRGQRVRECGGVMSAFSPSLTEQSRQALMRKSVKRSGRGAERSVTRVYVFPRHLLRRCTKRAVPPAYAKVWENSDTYRVHCCVLSGPEGKGDGGVILVCQLCGQYAQHNTVGLAAPCPVSAGKDIGVSVQQRLRRCARGQHLGFGRSV